MTLHSPAVILYDSNNVAMAVQDGVAIPANTKGLLFLGSDGTNSRIISLLNSNPAGTEYAVLTRNIPSGTQTVSGTVSVTGVSTETTLALIKAKTDNLDVALSTRAVTGLTDTQIRATPLPVNGTVTANAGTGTFTTNEVRPSTSTLTNVAASASSGTILASNASRKGAMIFNDSTSILYLKFGATASATSFTVKMMGGDYYEIPQPNYTGVVDGIWASATGSARVTEIT